MHSFAHRLIQKKKSTVYTFNLKKQVEQVCTFKHILWIGTYKFVYTLSVSILHNPIYIKNILCIHTHTHSLSTGKLIQFYVHIYTVHRCKIKYIKNVHRYIHISKT